MQVIEKYRLGDEVLCVFVDEHAVCPCEEERFGKIITWHRKYQIGDKNPFSTPEDFRLWLKTHPSIVLAVYMYDHCGVSLNTTGFSDPWDSGQIGYVFVELSRVRHHYGKKRVGMRTVEAVKRVLRGEVTIYSQYVSGEVYGFTLEKIHQCRICQKEEKEVIDSCGGFYGSNPVSNGMLECLPRSWQIYLQTLNPNILSTAKALRCLF